MSLICFSFLARHGYAQPLRRALLALRLAIVVVLVPGVLQVLFVIF